MKYRFREVREQSCWDCFQITTTVMCGVILKMLSPFFLRNFPEYKYWISKYQRDDRTKIQLQLFKILECNVD